MSNGNVIAFSEDVKAMTYEEGLAFIARTRRQLDRFHVALPHETGASMTPESESRLRFMLDDLEADIYRLLGPNAPRRE